MASDLSDQPASLRPGAIILARHGEPALSRKVMLSAREYSAFWAKYEIGGIVPENGPPDRLRKFVAECGALVSSTRLRAIQSARTMVGDREFPHHEILIEAPLPPPRFPDWVKLSPRIWGFIARFWWWFFNHHAGQETRAQAEARADQAADLIVDLAEQGQEVVVLAHGFFNFMVGRSLRKRGWRLTANQGWKYWSTRRFERS